MHYTAQNKRNHRRKWFLFSKNHYMSLFSAWNLTESTFCEFACVCWKIFFGTTKNFWSKTHVAHSLCDLMPAVLFIPQNGFYRFFFPFTARCHSIIMILIPYERTKLFIFAVSKTRWLIVFSQLDYKKTQNFNIKFEFVFCRIISLTYITHPEYVFGNISSSFFFYLRRFFPPFSILGTVDVMLDELLNKRTKVPAEFRIFNVFSL